MAKSIQQLSPGVYYRAFEGGNSGVVIEGRRALLIDTPFLPGEAREWRLELEQLGVNTFYGIINTDFHPEDFLGNAQFMPSVVWGHESAARQIARYKASPTDQVTNLAHEIDPRLADTLGEVDIITPTLGVDDRVTLNWPGDRIEIILLDGHTTASLGVYIAGEGILFSGDTVSVQEPPAMAQADSKGWLTALEKIRRLEPRIIVPGVGAPVGVEAVDEIERYITDMREQVIELFVAGASRRECVEKINLEGYFGDEHSPRSRRRQREAIERIYAEVRIEMRHK